MSQCLQFRGRIDDAFWVGAEFNEYKTPGIEKVETVEEEMKPLLIFFVAALSAAVNAEEEPLLRRGGSAPWWWNINGKERPICRSGCTDFSVGTRTTVELCDDSDVCKAHQRLSVDAWATRKCGEWARAGLIPVDDDDKAPKGRRFKHEPSKGSWISCAVFCETPSGSWYSPRGELKAEAFFPDGTWCHRDVDGQDFYCQSNLCLPPDVKLTQEELEVHYRQLEDSLENDFVLAEENEL